MMSFLFGESESRSSRIPERPETGANAPPIIKLCDAIIAQAVADGATRIRYVIDLGQEEPSDLHINGAETLDVLRLPRGSSADPNRNEFEQTIAEADVQIGPKLGAETTWVTVEFLLSGKWMHAVKIPPNLNDPLLRRLAFRFNYGKYVSLEIPENLIYVNGSFCSISHYDLKSPICAEIMIEPDLYA